MSVSLFSCAEEEQEVLPFYNSAQFDAEWIKSDEARYDSIHLVDTFSLKNQLGHTITKDSLDGYIYVANFFFTTCSSICPKMVSNLQVLQDSFATNSAIKLVSFSVMPWVDSVPALKEYGEIHDVNPNKWHLLTGSKERIYDLGRKSYFAEKGLGLQKTTDEFLHTESMLLIDKKGRLRGIYNATQKVDIGRVLEDIQVLLCEE
ncbi:MAG: SCO family protein [Bacteroidetes bacterium]|nr:SCO family protein [Bacteroidota bacterium]